MDSECIYLKLNMNQNETLLLSTYFFPKPYSNSKEYIIYIFFSLTKSPNLNNSKYDLASRYLISEN